jgi:nucleotide-binding universal stress UspA family protein
MKINKILVPTDFSDNADQALAFATKIATRFGSKITLFHVISLFQDDPNNPAFRFPDIEQLLQSMEKTALSRFQDLENRHQQISIKTKTVRGISAAEEIINFANAEEIDFIVMGTHGRTGLSHFLMGSVAERVIRHQPCPILTIKQNQAEKKLKPNLEKFVVAVDFSNYSKMALVYAVELASLFDASLEILYIIEEQIHPAYYVTGETSLMSMFPDLREKSLSALQEYAEKVIKKKIEYSTHVREGRAHSEIINFAEVQNADMIFMATHGLSGLDHFLIGSTTEKVVRKAKTPVFTVKAETK